MSQQKLELHIPEVVDDDELLDFIRQIANTDDVALEESDRLWILSSELNIGSLTDIFVQRLNSLVGFEQYAVGYNKKILRQFTLLKGSYPILVFDLFIND